MKNIVKIGLLMIALLIPELLNAQFYNGHQMNFGKNRVQYSQFEWMYYRYPKFDTYFYQQGKDIAQYTCDKAQIIIPEMEKYFGQTLQKRIIFIVYNRLSEFRQSNIGLQTDDATSNLGGVTKIIDNKVFLYYEGDHNDFDNQIREAVAEVLLQRKLGGGGLKNKVSTSAQITLPEWYVSGLAFYASHEWNAEIEDIIRDGFMSGKYKKINYLRGEDAKYAGYSMWHYLNRTYGRDVVSNVLYWTGISRNTNNAFRQVVNEKFSDLNREWIQYYKNKFSETRNQRELPDSTLKLYNPRRNTVYAKPLTSPDGKYTFYHSNKMGKYKLFLRDNKTGEIQKILVREQKLEQIIDYQYPVAAWQPSSKIVSFAIDEKGYVYFYQYNVATGNLTSKQLPKFDKIYSMSYSDDGLNLVMSVQLSGTTDIVIFNVASNSYERITQDLADDQDPKFIEGSRKIVFASNRISDTLKMEKIDNHQPIQKNYDIFVYDLNSNSPVLTRITNTPYETETSPAEIEQDQFTYLSDKNGIINRYRSVYDSTIIAIDTTVHYAYTNSYKPATNFNRNILSLNFDRKSKRADEAFRDNGRYRLYTENGNYSDKLPDVLDRTYFRILADKRQAKLDSLELVKQRKAELERKRTDSIVANPPKDWKNPDSLKYDMINYVFEQEKSLAYQLVFYQEDLKARYKREQEERPKQRLYYTTFYTDYMIAQVDFTNLNQSYQPFTTGPYYFNSNATAFFRVGVKDLFEDYRISAAFRLGANLDSYEYYFIFEDLKKRWDKQYIFHRFTYNNNNDPYSLLKVRTNEAMFVAGYPFNQTSAVKGTLGLRYDKSCYLVTDYPYLDIDPKYQVFAKGKLEYIFDNSISLGTNTPMGTKFKAWSELYQQVEGKYDIISSWGFDFRYYQKLHRNMIFATRLAGATSFGSGKILYYLGGVDNWTMFTTDNSKMFDQSIRIDQNENYIYQAVGTNMRGFIQNCRNGNTFAVWNNELRLPLFRYLFNRPLTSKMINDFQLIGFFDAGSAWTGFVPNGVDNAYNKYELQNGAITMVVDVARPSIVCGYGFGFRTSILGYFMRFDWAWGIEGHIVLPRVFYFSLGLDF